ncbi:sulfide:quinone reductase [Nautilia sp. PV-1]|uniref:NAD(P)/FAD-dependent oxidoreductase n=1 Tax=Nautilia sp. PV-1 TaxID=2579250 RepID=UPI000FD73EFC|nr:FAD-dependent oxidoreductase [Nautilia sp. PV-1]AZV47198.1 sulfide:quinone reductase [Nautilia sp. PV-1]
MAKVVILGAGISGHTAALNLKKLLGKKHDIIVVSPNSHYQWVPSNVWVGTGHMKADQVKFPLEIPYKKMGIIFKQAFARTIHPDGDTKSDIPFVMIEYIDGKKEKIEYDYLINATGPKLNFEATPGLGPDTGNTVSICSYTHATEAWKKLQKTIDKMKKGQKQKIVIGLGHGGATCQGAAIEYTLNVASLIKEMGLQQYADIKYLSNEYMAGDLGMGGAYVRNNGYVAHTKNIIESLFTELGIKWYMRNSVYKVESGKIYYEHIDGSEHIMEYDFAMLIPAFAGVGIKGIDKNGNEITNGSLFKSNGLMTVDADYESTNKPYHEWGGEDWPKKLQNPTWKNIFAIGIAFAPPHPISKPMKTKSGRPLTPAPPRTGMPSAVMGNAVAHNIAATIKAGGEYKFPRSASMAEFASICVVSIGYGFRGMAGTMSVYPTIPDYKKYPDFGRDLTYTLGEPGIAGHWFKYLMHHLFLYKAKANPGWWLIPD